MLLSLTNALSVSLALFLVARIIMEPNDNRATNDGDSPRFQALC